MTADSFDRRVGALLEELAQPAFPPYLDDLLRQTARTAQRPRWTFLTRWLPMDTTLPRTAALGAPGWRAIAVLAALLLTSTVLVALVGQRRPLPPYGIARNGTLATVVDGDLVAVDPVTGEATILVGGPSVDSAPVFSPDGTRLVFTRRVNGVEALMGANADGSEVVQLTGPLPGLALVDTLLDESPVDWSPDGRELAVTHYVTGEWFVSLVATDGSGMRTLDLPFQAFDAAFRPPDGAELVVRSETDERADLHLVGRDGRVTRSLGLVSDGALGVRHDLRAAAWSPDGTRLAYQTPSDAGVRIHVVQADGTGDRIIGAADPDVADTQPVWSPDGRWVAVQRHVWMDEMWAAILPVDGDAEVIEIDASRTEWSQARGWESTWSPDGGVLYLWNTDDHRLLQVDPATGDAREAAWPSDGRPGWQRLAP